MLSCLSMGPSMLICLDSIPIRSIDRCWVRCESLKARELDLIPFFSLYLRCQAHFRPGWIQAKRTKQINNLLKERDYILFFHSADHSSLFPLYLAWYFAHHTHAVIFDSLRVEKIQQWSILLGKEKKVILKAFI